MHLKTELKMELTEMVLKEERDLDDEMDEDDDGDDDVLVDLVNLGHKVRDPAAAFLFASGTDAGDFDADSEDLDDEMDGEDDDDDLNDGASSGASSSDVTKRRGSSSSSSGQKDTCSICRDSFLSKKSLRQHVRCEHLQSCYWTCQNCGGVFPDVEQFKTHLVKVHKMTRDVFSLDEPEENPLLRPCLTIKEDIKPCPECEAEFGSKTSLNVHRLRRHISKRLTQNVACPVCGESNVEDLTAHVRSEHRVEGVVCPHCGKILSKTCTLNRHIEQVHLNLQIHKKVTCDTCGKVFSKKGHLDRHIRTIHMGMKESSQPCPHCGKVFSTKSSLEPHIEMVHKGVRKACPECGKVLSDLWKHMRTVHGHYRRRAKIPKEELDLSAEVLQQKNGGSSRRGSAASSAASGEK